MSSQASATESGDAVPLTAARLTGRVSSDVVLVSEDQFDLERVRAEWIGTHLGRVAGRYPVEYDPIRRFCHMTGDTNPLFVDPAVAAAGPYGGVICPPGFIRYFAGPGPWPIGDHGPGPTPRQIPRLGDRGINLNTQLTFLSPVLVGDQLSADWSVADVFEKRTRLDPRSLWIVTEAQITNQHGVVVAGVTNTVLYHRPAETPPSPTDATREVETRTRPQLMRPFSRDLSVGDQLPGFAVEITPTMVALQVSGSQDWNLVHHDQPFATAGGHAGIFLNTGWTVGHLSRVLTDWLGAEGWLERLAFRMDKMIEPGDLVTAAGSVQKRDNTTSGGVVYEVDVWLESATKGVTTTGNATVRSELPSAIGDEARP